MASKIVKLNWKALVALLATLIIGGTAGAGIDLAIRPTEEGDIIVEAKQTLQLSEQQLPAVVETEAGKVETADAPTVELVDGGEIPTELEQMSEEEIEKAGQGFAIDISTPWAVVQQLTGQCIYLGNPYGSQCVNTTNLIAENQVGYWMSTCGTGAARGIWDCADYNARGGYELITDPTQLRPGDLFVTWGGEWGHTGMVIGYYNNGYVPVFSTNQGGAACNGGGAAANTINLSMATFSGAFRWHGWDHLFVEPEPEPTPEEIPLTGCKDWSVEQGDTIIGIGYACENVILSGDAVDRYADTWISQTYMPGHSVLWGWQNMPSHYGLYAGDYLLHEL